MVNFLTKMIMEKNYGKNYFDLTSEIMEVMKHFYIKKNFGWNGWGNRFGPLYTNREKNILQLLLYLVEIDLLLLSS